MTQFFPLSTFALPNLIEVETNLQLWREAVPLLDEHLRAGEEPARALRHLGLVAWNSGQPDLAALVLKSAATLSPGDPWILGDLAGALQASGQAKEARDCLLMALEFDRQHAGRWLMLAGLHRELGEETYAEGAFLNALHVDPTLQDAWIGLGILRFQNRQYHQAVEALRRGLALGSQSALVHACLGEALYLTGDVPGAAQAYATQMRLGANEPQVIRKNAFVQFLDVLIASPLDEALATYHAQAGDHAEDVAAMIEKAMHALSGYGYRDGAVRCAQSHLTRAPQDPIARYLTAALGGAPISRAPDDFLVSFFDQFAETFDQKLVDVLEYDLPQKMVREIGKLGGTHRSCLDAGCGTGLAGPLLAAPGRRLVGVDVSPGMLAKAAERSAYHDLATAELHDYLARCDERFDLVFAADVLIYMGDLAGFVKGAARCLNEGGLLALSIETTQAGDYEVLSSGRFAHRPAYVEALATGLFRLEKAIETQIRLDAVRPAMGAMMFLRRLPLQ